MKNILDKDLEAMQYIFREGPEYAIKMMTQYSEKTVQSKKVYSKKDRQSNKIKSW